MYEVFDSFLATDWWHKHNPSDENMFYQALHKIVHYPAFSADTMGEYMRSKFELSSGYDAEDYRVKSIAKYVTAAWAVRDYFAATREL
jgi:hypothetical protein